MNEGLMALLARLWMALHVPGRSEEHTADIRESQTVRRRAERSIDRWNEMFSQSWERHR